MGKEPDDIARMCSDANLGAFELMVERYGMRLYRFIYSLTLDGTAADDLIQETFLKAFNDIGKYKRNVNFESWLRRIAHNLFVDSVRTEKHRVEREVKFSSEGRFRDDEPRSIERAIIKKKRADEIRRAVMSLPEKQRTAIALFTWGDAHVAEIAGVMKCSEGTVMSHLHRARHALREILKDKIDDTELES